MVQHTKMKVCMLSKQPTQRYGTSRPLSTHLAKPYLDTLLLPLPQIYGQHDGQCLVAYFNHVLLVVSIHMCICAECMHMLHEV